MEQSWELKICLFLPQSMVLHVELATNGPNLNVDYSKKNYYLLVIISFPKYKTVKFHLLSMSGEARNT